MSETRKLAAILAADFLGHCRRAGFRRAIGRKPNRPLGRGFRTFPNGLKAWGEPTLTGAAADSDHTCVSTAIQQ
jgi:hypothetical protein